MPYPRELAARTAIVDLLGGTWHHVPSAIARARRWGGDWFEVSTPFVRSDGERPVSVVGVIEMPLRVLGADVIAAGVHGVCTHPAHRGRGHFRSAMEEALGFVDSFASLALLWTEEPAIYERFGFRRVVEEIARVELAPIPPRGEPPRRLDPARDEDLALLRRVLATRAPVSERLATRDRGAHFLIDLALHGSLAPALVHLPALDAIACVETERGVLRIHDVIGARIPPLTELLAHLGSEGRAIELAVTPDLLWDGPITRAPHDASDVLMVRGPLAVEPPVALSVMVRC